MDTAFLSPPLISSHSILTSFPSLSSPAEQNWDFIIPLQGHPRRTCLVVGRESGYWCRNPLCLGFLSMLSVWSVKGCDKSRSFSGREDYTKGLWQEKDIEWKEKENTEQLFLTSPSLFSTSHGRKRSGLRSSRPGCESWLHLIPFVWPWLGF